MTNLSVCLLSDAFPPIIDGVSNAVLNYADQIQKKGGQSLVVTPSYPKADDSAYEFSVIRYPSIDVRKLTTGYMAGIPFSSSASWATARQRTDIIHAHCPMMSAVLGRMLRKRADAPLIMTYHTKYDIDIANVVKNKALQASGIKSIVTNVSAFDEVWTVSKGAGENLRSLGYQGDYIVMPNGVDFSRGEASKEAIEQVTAGWDLPAGVPVFLFVGRLMWYKGFRITFNALVKLKQAGIDFRMAVIGDGGDSKDIRAYAEELGLCDKVFFIGRISERETLRAWYTRADLMLFPSTFDTNGLVVREASACNLPSVLIKGSCAAEDTLDGQNSFWIEEDAESMFQCLKKICGDLNYLHQVGERAGQDLYLSWSEAVDLALERYQIVMELKKNGAFKERAAFSDNLLATSGDLMYTLDFLARVMNLNKYDTKSYRRNVANSKKLVMKSHKKQKKTEESKPE